MLSGTTASSGGDGEPAREVCKACNVMAVPVVRPSRQHTTPQRHGKLKLTKVGLQPASGPPWLY